jgi:acetyl/propionyl-CoA carboxylase alpha subunit
MQFRYRIPDSELAADVEKTPAQGEPLTVRIGDAEHRVELLRESGGQLVFRVDGRVVRAVVARDGERRFVHVGGGFPTSILTAEGAKARGGAKHSHGGGLEAQMHGQVVAVAAVVGVGVKRGDLLVTLEAMKMEMRLVAPFDGTVRAVSCKVGEVVERGRVLVEVEPG